MPSPKPGTTPYPGLCADCIHAKLVKSDRASVFLQCQLAFTDSRFAKYPRLPVRTCSGYKKRDEGKG